MYELIIIGIYSLVVLVFVPLDKIGKAQLWVKSKIKQAKDKVD